MMTFKNPEGQTARWLELLSQYTFGIDHRAGIKHSNADGLSRRPEPCTSSCRQCDKMLRFEQDSDEDKDHDQRVQVVTRSSTANVREQNIQVPMRKTSKNNHRLQGKPSQRSLQRQPRNAIRLQTAYLER